METGLPYQIVATFLALVALTAPPCRGETEACADFDAAIAAYPFDAPEYFEILPNGLTVIVDEDASARRIQLVLLGRPDALRDVPNAGLIQDAVIWGLHARLTKACAESFADSVPIIGPPKKRGNLSISPLDPNIGCLAWDTKPGSGKQIIALLCQLAGQPEIDAEGLRAMETTRIWTLPLPGLDRYHEWLATLLAGSESSAPVVSIAAELTDVDMAGLPEYHRRFFAPNNLILAIAGPDPGSQIAQWVSETFGRIDRMALDSLPPTDLAQGRIEESTRGSRKSGIDVQQVLAVGALPGAQAPNIADIQIAAAVLEARMQANLVARRQLASNLQFKSFVDREVGWCVLLGQVLHENSVFTDALTLECEKLAFDGPTGDEFTSGRNRVWDERMSSRVSQTDRCQRVALDVYLGLGVNYDRKLAAALKTATPASVRQAAAQYFRPDRWEFVGADQPN